MPTILKAVVAPIIVLSCLVLFVVPIALRSTCGGNENPSVANLRTLNTSEVTYLSQSGSYGTIQDLIDAKLIDDAFLGTKAGYNYTITLDATASGYTAEAVPALVTKWHAWFSGAAPTKTGRYNYYSVPDAVVRFGTLAPAPAQIGKSVQ